MHTRLFSKNKVKGYLKYTAAAIAGGVVEGVTTNAVGSALFTNVLDREGHNMIESLYRGAAGGAALWFVAGLYEAYEASNGNFIDKDQPYWKVQLKIALMGIAAQLLGFAMLLNNTEMSLEDSMNDIGFGAVFTFIPLALLAFYYLDEIADFTDKPFLDDAKIEAQIEAARKREQRNESRLARSAQRSFNPPPPPAASYEMAVVTPQIRIDIDDDAPRGPKR